AGADGRGQPGAGGGRQRWHRALGRPQRGVRRGPERQPGGPHRVRRGRAPDRAGGEGGWRRGEGRGGGARAGGGVRGGDERPPGGDVGDEHVPGGAAGNVASVGRRGRVVLAAGARGDGDRGHAVAGAAERPVVRPALAPTERVRGGIQHVR